MPRAGPPTRQQRHEAAERAADRHRRIAAARDQDARGAAERLDLDARERRRREQQQVAEQVVEPVAAAVDEHDPPRRPARSRRRTRARDRSRPSRPDGGRRSCPTRPRRRPRPGRPSRDRRRDGRRARRARSATRRPGVGRDHVGVGRAATRARRARPADCPANTIATGTGATPFMVPPSAGITRSRFEGSVAGPAVTPDAWPPSQPGSPELPMGVAVRAYPSGAIAPGLNQTRCAGARIGGWRRAGDVRGVLPRALRRGRAQHASDGR